MEELRVLLIEDSAEDAELFGFDLQLCRRFRPTLRWVSEAEKATSAATEFEPDVIFLDYRLGPVSGLDLLSELATDPAASPVIMLTAHGSEEIAVQAMQGGAADYLVKGKLSPEALERSITNALEKRAMREQIAIQSRVLDSIDEAVFTIDDRYRISSLNRAAEEFVGIRREHAIGRSCHETLGRLFGESGLPLLRTMESGQGLIGMTTHARDGEGRAVTLSVSTALLRDAAGTVIGGVQSFHDLSQVEELRRAMREQHTIEGILGRSSSMRALFDVLPSIASTTSTVLIEGASGTGKELFARAIHSLSPRRDGPFVAVNCAAFPESLIESELFGYRAGAFTGAHRDKPGRFVLAEGGTIFLDEIGDMTLPMQTKLLRVLQEQMVEPLGAVEPVRADVRVVAATNRDLAGEVADGRFRQDLYYRLSVVGLKLPTLAERTEDIPLLAQHFLDRGVLLNGRDVRAISEPVMERLLSYSYPGNVRELENIIEHALAVCDGALIRLEHLPPRVRGVAETDEAGERRTKSLAALEATYLEDLLQRHGGNRSSAARELGIHPSTLYRKIRSLGVQVPATDGRHRQSPSRG